MRCTINQNCQKKIFLIEDIKDDFNWLVSMFIFNTSCTLILGFLKFKGADSLLNLHFLVLVPLQPDGV